MNSKPSRRGALLKIGASAAAIPALLMTPPAVAVKVDALRSALKYQSGPKGEARCSTCLHYVGDPSDGAQGTCAIIPGDTEIDAQGWCAGFAKKPA